MATAPHNLWQTPSLLRLLFTSGVYYIMESQKFHTVSWSDLHTSTFKLAEKISKSGKRLSLIVAIARGGMTITQVLSDFLTLPVATFTISSYKDMQQKDLSDISFHVGARLENQDILLVDDISDTGKTFIRGTKYLKELGANSIITASLFIKPWTMYIPDFYHIQSDKWIILPYEVKETIDSIGLKMQKEGKTKIQIQTKLKQIGIPKPFINKLI